MKLIFLLLTFGLLLLPVNAFALGYDHVDVTVPMTSIIELESNDIFLATINIQNNGDSTESIFSSYLYLKDSENRKFSPLIYYKLDEEKITKENCPLPDSIDINPGLSHKFQMCYQVPKGVQGTAIVIQNMDDSICEPIYGCKTSRTNFNIAPSEASNTSSVSNSDDGIKDNMKKIEELENRILELISKISLLEQENKRLKEQIESGTDIQKSNTLSKGIASFVDSEKDPQNYIDRYNNEESYRNWFNDNYPEYDSIYEAVGKREPVPDWIRNNAQWWTEGKISEDEFVSGIEFLVKKGIVKVN